MTILRAQAKVTEGIVVGPVEGDAEREECWRIRYRAYLDAGPFPCNEAGLFRDKYDDLESTELLGIKHQRGLVGTMRVCFSSDKTDGHRLPCREVFPEVDLLRRDVDGPVVELSRLAIDPSVTNTSYKSTLYAGLVRYCMTELLNHGVAAILIAASDRMLPFYTRILGFETLGTPRPYPPRNVPVTMTAIRLAGVAGRSWNNRFFTAMLPQNENGKARSIRS